MRSASIPVLLLLAALPFRSSSAPAEAATSLSPTAAEIADLVLESAGGARWIVVDQGPLAAVVRIRAAETAPETRVLTVAAAPEEEIEAARTAAASIPSPRVRDALELGPVPFLLAWLEEDAAAARRETALLAVPAVPALAAGFDAVPDGAVWRVRSATEASDAAALTAAADRLADVRDRLGEALSSAGPEDAALVSAARLHAARLCNDLGRRLAAAGKREAARAAFLGADAAAPALPSALLNLASLAREKNGADAATRTSLAARLENVQPDIALAASGGVLWRPADFFDAGWFWTISGIPASDTNALAAAFDALPESAPPAADIRRALSVGFALQLGNADLERALLREIGPDGLTPSQRLRAADLLFAKGEKRRALALLRRFATPAEGDPDPARPAWADEPPEGADIPFRTLADARLLDLSARAGDAAPALAAAARLARSAAAGQSISAAERENLAAAFVELARWEEAAAAWRDVAAAAAGAGTEDKTAANALSAPTARLLSAACAALASGDAASAKKAIAPLLDPRAAPAPWAAWRTALAADFRLADRAAAAKDAEALIALRPRDHFAHWILGSLAGAKGDTAGAVSHLRLSVAERPTVMALNDLASLLAGTGNGAAAEAFARDALRSGGASVPAVHDTLGEALASQGKMAEAAAAFRESLAVAKAAGAPSDPRTHLHLAETLAALADWAGAEAEIAAVDADKDGLSIDERERLGTVRRAVKKGREAEPSK